MNKDKKQAVDLLDFYYMANRLKSTKRAGWKNHGIQNAESVADHTFGVLILCLLLHKSLDLDLEKLLVMALFHDIGESIIGDITPREKENYNNKSQREESAVKTIFSKIKESKYYIELWKDFEYTRTLEGEFLKQIDKFEMALQALKYINDTNIGLLEFIDTAQLIIEDESIRKLLEFASTEYSHT